MRPYYVVSCDPGKMTGVTTYNVEERTLSNAWQVTADEYASWAYQFAMGARQMERDILFVCERFIIGKRTLEAGRGDENWSIELIGVTRHVAKWWNHAFTLVAASDAKKFAPDTRLRECGWYRPGKGHANDAIRVLALGLADKLAIPPPWMV